MVISTVSAPTSEPGLDPRGVDPRLEPTVDAFNQLSPANQELVMSMIRQLAEREGIAVAVGPSMMLQQLEEGIPLWKAALISEGYSARTIGEYERIIRLVLREVPNPTSQNLREWLAKKLGECSPGTVHQCQNALKQFFTYLHGEGLWSINPMNGVKPIKTPKRIREDASPESVQRLMLADLWRQEDTDKFRLMIVLLATTGLRANELVTIRKGGIRLDADLPGMRVIGKGNKERIVPITSPFVRDMLRSYIERYCNGSSIYLFPGAKDGHQDPGSVNRAIRRACERENIEPRVTTHQLRHFFATYALKHGAKAEAISKMLGHESVSTTLDIYRHVHPEEIWQEHGRFAPLSGRPVLEAGKEDIDKSNQKGGARWKEGS